MNVILPDYRGKSVYSLACGIAKYLGVKRNCLGSIDISASKLALVLLDGFGCNIAMALGIKNMECMTTVFPSSTATVVTTLFTALTPGEHGILGFSVFSKLLGTIVYPMTYTTPFQSSLKEIPFQLTFPNVKPYLKEVQDKKTVDIIPKGMEQNDFSLMTHASTTIVKTYNKLWEAYQEASNVMREGYDFVSIYIPDVDTVSHYSGPSSLATMRTARDVWGMVQELAEKFKDYTFIVTADHGLVDVQERYFLNFDQDLLKHLDVPPYGDSRAIMLKSRYNASEHLRDKYPSLTIFEGSQVERLLGKVDKSLDLPDVIAVPNDNKSAYNYVFTKKQMEEISKFKGNHGGLSEDEMLVPLIVLNQ